MPFDLARQTIFAFALSVGAVYVSAIFPDAIYISRLKKLGEIPSLWRRIAIGCCMYAVSFFLVLLTPLEDLARSFGEQMPPEESVEATMFTIGVTTWLLMIPVTLLCVLLEALRTRGQEADRLWNLPGGLPR